MHITFCIEVEIFKLLCLILGCFSYVGAEFFNSPSKQKDVFPMNTLITLLDAPLPNCGVWPSFSLLHLHFIVRLPSSRLFRFQVEPGREFLR